MGTLGRGRPTDSILHFTTWRVVSLRGLPPPRAALASTEAGYATATGPASAHFGSGWLESGERHWPGLSRSKTQPTCGEKGRS